MCVLWGCPGQPCAHIPIYIHILILNLILILILIFIFIHIHILIHILRLFCLFRLIWLFW